MKNKGITLLVLLFALHVQAQEFVETHKVNKHVSVIALADPEDKLPVQLYGLSYDKAVKIPMVYQDIEATNKLIFLHGMGSEEPDRLRMGAADLNGNIVVPVRYDFIDDNYNGTFSLMRNQLWGACNQAGDVLVPVEYTKVEVFNNLLLATKESGAALYKADGTVLVPFGPHEIRIVDEFEELYSVKENGKFVLRFSENRYILEDFVPVSNTLFAQRTEVSIRQYFACIADLRWMGSLVDANNRPVSVADLLPDTNFVEEKLRPVYRNLFEQLAIEEGLDFVKYDLSRSKKEKYEIQIPMVDYKDALKMLDFPVTGITRQQAELYTLWLCMASNDYLFDTDDEYHVNYRLPSETEWVSVAESGLSEKMRPNHVLDSVNAEGCMLFIYNNLPPCKSYDDYVANSFGDGSTKALSMNPDWNGLHQLFGNVSEFTSDPGINKGGSYQHSSQDAKTTNSQKGEGPQPWLGFRVVADIVSL